MQASVLFSLAVSTDFTVAAGKKGHMCLRCSCKVCHRRRAGKRTGSIKNRTREADSAPVQKDDEEEWSRVDNLTGVRGFFFFFSCKTFSHQSFIQSRCEKECRGESVASETRWSYCFHLRPLVRNQGQERGGEGTGGEKTMFRKWMQCMAGSQPGIRPWGF